MNPIDESRYNKLADWAESDEPELQDTASDPDLDRTETLDLLRKAGGLDNS
jgi:hypothetical protein